MSSLENASASPHGGDPAGELISPRSLVIVLVAFGTASLAAAACGTHVWTHLSPGRLVPSLSASCVTWVVVFVKAVRALDGLVKRS